MTMRTHDRGQALLDVADLGTRVGTTIDEFLSVQTEVLADVSDDCDPLVRYVADLVSGGKRLRPAFCYWAWRAAGAPDDPAAVVAATALEFLRAAALIHDDVMDGSDTRRGAPAMHRRFAGLHRGHRWNGDGDHFGVSAAVLAGDLCLTWSDELFSGCGLSPAAVGRGVFNSMRTQLMGGQYLDLLDQVSAVRRPTAAVERDRRVMRFKSAKYTVEHPLLLLGGADDCLLARLSAFGLPLGEAFQLRDDILAGVRRPRPHPASRPGMICARTGGPCSWRWPSSALPPYRKGLGNAPEEQRAGRGRRRRAAGGDRRHGRAGRGRTHDQRAAAGRVGHARSRRAGAICLHALAEAATDRTL